MASAPSAAHMLRENVIVPQLYSKNEPKKGEPKMTTLFHFFHVTYTTSWLRALVIAPQTFNIFNIFPVYALFEE